MNITIIDNDEIGIFIAKTTVQMYDTKINILTFLEPEKALETFLKISNDFFPDLILLDINMPILNGFELLDKMYANRSELMSIPVCLVSSSNAEIDRLKANKYPSIIEFITKPIKFAMLETILSSIEKNKTEDKNLQ